MHVDLSRLGFDHSLEVRRAAAGVPHELKDGEQVASGDRIRATVRTSDDAFLYLAFCAHGKLEVYPEQGGIQTRAGRTIAAPVGGDLVVDGEPGAEVLYLIVSRDDLASADPRLEAEIARQRPSDRPSDCGKDLDARIAPPPAGVAATVTNVPGEGSAHGAAARRVLRGNEFKKKPRPAPTTGSGQASRDLAAPTPTPTPAAASGSAVPRTPPPDAGFERNPGRIVWYSGDGDRGLAVVVAADRDGIAVVRYGFQHIAGGSP